MTGKTVRRLITGERKLSSFVYNNALSLPCCTALKMKQTIRKPRRGAMSTSIMR